MESKRPEVEVAVFVIKYKQILIGKRKDENEDDDGTWCLPGTSLGYRDDVFDCAVRAAYENAAVKTKNLRMAPITNDNSPARSRHTVTLFVVADYDSGNPASDPDQFSEWRWCKWESLPKPLFHSLQNFVDKGFSPFDY